MAEAKERAAERAREYRARRRAGLRLVRAWVPDVRNPAVRTRIQQQLAAFGGHPDEAEALRFIEGATADMDWDA